MIDPDHSPWANTVLMVLLSVWAGFVSYLRTLVKGAEFRLLTFLSHVSSSALAGLITALLCDQYDMTVQWTGVACAIAGHMGAEAIKIIEAKVQKKAREIDL